MVSKVVAGALAGVVLGVVVVNPLQARVAPFSAPAPVNLANMPLLARSSHSEDRSTHRSEDQSTHHSAHEYLPDPHALRREHKLAGTGGSGSSSSGSSQMRDLRLGQPQAAPKSRESDGDK